MGRISPITAPLSRHPRGLPCPTCVARQCGLRLSADGQPLDTEARVSAQLAARQHDPHAAADPFPGFSGPVNATVHAPAFSRPV